MRRLHVFLAALLMASLMTSKAQAIMISFEPDDFVSGTDVSNVNPFVSLSTFSNSWTNPYVPTISPVYVVQDQHCLESQDFCSAITGTHVFQDGHGDYIVWGGLGDSIVNARQCFEEFGRGLPAARCHESFNVLLMTFANPTDFVEISGGFFADDQTYLWGFDDSFNFIGTMNLQGDSSRCRGETAFSEFCQVTTSLSSPSGGIRYVIAGGWSNGTSLDNLRFSVPEPTSIALLGLGLIGAFTTRRSRQRRRSSAPPIE